MRLLGTWVAVSEPGRAARWVGRHLDPESGLRRAWPDDAGRSSGTQSRKSVPAPNARARGLHHRERCRTRGRVRMLAAVVLLLAASTISDGFVCISLQESQWRRVQAQCPSTLRPCPACTWWRPCRPGCIADRFGRAGVLNRRLYAKPRGLCAPVDRTPRWHHRPGSGDHPDRPLRRRHRWRDDGDGQHASCREFRRTTGLVLLATVAGLGKAASSIAVGWLMPRPMAVPGRSNVLSRKTAGRNRRQRTLVNRGP